VDRGYFFAFVVLRPASSMFEAPQRLQLWSAVFAQFFPWVWAFIAVLVMSGYVDLFARLGGFAAPLYLVAMQVIGWVMILLFAWLSWVPVRRLHQAVHDQRWAQAAAAMLPIRRIMAINLVLGLVLAVIGGLRPMG
jgi:uncharacterized membrane protein